MGVGKILAEGRFVCACGVCTGGSFSKRRLSVSSIISDGSLEMPTPGRRRRSSFELLAVHGSIVDAVGDDVRVRTPVARRVAACCCRDSYCRL
jgi:hypothetical protein